MCSCWPAPHESRGIDAANLLRSAIPSPRLSPKKRITAHSGYPLISGVSVRQILLSEILNPVPVKERLPFCDKLSAPWLILVLGRCDANCLLDLLCHSHCHDAFFL
jgi:hypothetical protein